MEARGIRRMASLGVIALATSGGLIGTAIAATKSTIKVTPSQVYAGNSVRVYGNAANCPRGDRVRLLSRAFSHAHMYNGVPVIYATSGTAGAYSVHTTIPLARAQNRYQITGRCAGHTLGVTAYLQVWQQGY